MAEAGGPLAFLEVGSRWGHWRPDQAGGRGKPQRGRQSMISHERLAKEAGKLREKARSGLESYKEIQLLMRASWALAEAAAALRHLEGMNLKEEKIKGDVDAARDRGEQV